MVEIAVELERSTQMPLYGARDILINDLSILSNLLWMCMTTSFDYHNSASRITAEPITVDFV